MTIFGVSGVCYIIWIYYWKREKDTLQVREDIVVSVLGLVEGRKSRKESWAWLPLSQCSHNKQQGSLALRVLSSVLSRMISSELSCRLICTKHIPSPLFTGWKALPGFILNPFLHSLLTITNSPSNRGISVALSPWAWKKLPESTDTLAISHLEILENFWLCGIFP